MAKVRELTVLSKQDARVVVERSFNDALSMLATIELLEAGNDSAVTKRMNEGPSLAFQIARDALLTHLVIFVARPFGRLRDDDRHIGRVLLDGQEVHLLRTLGIAASSGNGLQLIATAERLSQLRSSEAAVSVLHFRNKVVAHSSSPDPSIPIPLWGQLFQFCRDVAAICETVHGSCGIGNRSLKEELEEYRREATVYFTTRAGRP